MAFPLAQEQGKSPWKYKVIEGLIGGLNLSIRPDQMEDNELITAKNILIQKNEVRVDTGYKIFASAVVGVPQSTYQFDQVNGISELLLITTETLYKYSASQDAWQFVRGEAGTTALGGEQQGETAIDVTAITGFTAGQRIGIMLDDGSQHQSTITIPPSGATITIADAIPTGREVPQGAAVVQAVSLSGTEDIQVVGVTVISHNWFVFTNGVDVVKRYDGLDCVNVPGLPGSGNVIARTLALYNAALFLINTIEDGDAHPRRVRRSNSADPSDWDSGTAGFDDLLDEEDDLHCAELLGPYLIIYSERSIIRGEFLGTGGLNYSFNTMVRGEGSISQAGAADVGDVHFVMMQSNIYAYRGSFDLEPIGDNVYYKLYGSQAEMSVGLRHRSFCFYVEELDEVWFFWPSTSAAVGCNRLLRYNVGEKTWAEREFPNEFLGFGFFQSRSSRFWNTLIGPWTNQKWKWNERTLLDASPTTHLCPAASNTVMEYDYIQPLDNGEAIPYIVETKDFLDPDVVNRFDMLEFAFRGQDVRVEVSTNSGISWMQLGLVSRSTMGRHRLFQQFPFEKVRFRFSGESEFVLTFVGFSYREESEA